MRAQDLFDLTGQVAVVTGAAAGLGLAMAEVFAANGAHVAMLDKDGPGLDAAAKGLVAAGASVEGHVVDIADRARQRAVIDDIAARAGRLDIAVANAGMSAGPGFGFGTGQGGLTDVDQARWDEVVAVNLTGNFTTMQAAARHMVARKSGRIVMIASIAGLKAEHLVGYAYAATKAAVVNLVRQAALELAAHNVLVNCIAPGPFSTNIAGGRIRDPEIAKQFAAMVPLARIAATDEIKGLALLLASPASSFITGTVIPIDGGAMAG
jgi:NAD(P)-dependent dehydrogenase (short-subunit alcohol dehydrogenase family)